MTSKRFLKAQMRIPSAVHGALLVAVLSAMLLIAARSAHAQTETVLYNFTGGTDGADPLSGLTSDAKGNFYGTAYEGGLGAGTIFELSPNGSGGWNETVLHSFNGGLNIGPDGAGPIGPVIFDRVGNLYGPTKVCGTDYADCSYGTVFELSPVGATWNETIPLSCSCTDPASTGIFPVNGLIIDAAGNLYGTTSASGPYSGYVFDLSPSDGGWPEQLLYATSPISGLTMDASGNIFGATSSTVFELSPTGYASWNSTVIHTFACPRTDGTIAVGTRVLDQSGNIYGTTYAGGAMNYGTVYKLSLGGNGAWAEKILYSFKSGTDGSNPAAGIVLDALGNIYGTTTLGGGTNNGTGFELAAQGNSHYDPLVLWTFSGTDGASPNGSLVLDSAGNLYGTTALGGSSGAGTVFEVSRGGAATATALTSTLNPSIHAQPITFTTPATTSGPVAPTGTVNFKWGPDGIGTGTLNASGVATFTTSILKPGPYKITAVYKGDA